jgi:endonuclease YncB( thermonuclease family)
MRMSNRTKIGNAYEIAEQETRAKKAGLWRDANPVPGVVRDQMIVTSPC